VEIGVADPAVKNLYLDIAIGGLAPRNSGSGEWRGGASRGEGFDGIGFGLGHKIKAREQDKHRGADTRNMLDEIPT
jgi:hypothetical protein